MRIHGDFPRLRPRAPGREGLPMGSTHFNPSVVSRPKASSNEVPQRPLQVSKSEVASTRPSNPQWMRTLEEKYRKLHVKIDSYPPPGSRGLPLPHTHVGGMLRYNSAHRTGHKPLATLDKPVDLVRLGKSVLRFAKTRRYSDQRSKTTRSNQRSHQSLNNDVSTEAARPTDSRRTIDPHDLSDKQPRGPRLIERSSDKNNTDPPNCCDQQGLPQVGDKRCVDIPWGDLHQSSGGPSETGSGSEEYSVSRRPLTDRPVGQEVRVPSGYQARCVTANLEAFMDSLTRSFSPSPSCFSHPSTHRSSWRPKSSQAASESASYRVHRQPTKATMPRNGRKTVDGKRINVLLGMSQEARFAISETRKEMTSYSRSVPGHDSDAHKCDSNNNKSSSLRKLPRVRPTSENIISWNGKVDLDTSEGNDSITSDKHVQPTPEVTGQENALSSASVNTTFDEDSTPVNLSVTSATQDDLTADGHKLPGIERNGIVGSHSFNYKQVRQHNGLSAGKYSVLRNISREQTFQITPPDYDVRFREILTCEIPESETPPPDIKAQAVAKCSEWLNKRYMANIKSSKENVT